jgi:hypothetical protein
LIVTLLDHLRQEDWTPAIPLIDRALCAGVRIRHIPAPSGHANWLEEDYEELLAEFLAAGRGPARLVQLAIDAVDDQHLRGLLDKTVKWFLADRAREDPLPKLRRTLRTILDRMPTVIVVDTATVSLAEYCHRDQWGGDEAKLVAVAAAVTTGPPPWGADAAREGPPTDKESFEALCAAILKAAGAPLLLNILTRIVGKRLQLHRRWDDRLDDDVSVGVIATGSPPVSASARVLAVEIWDELDDQDRELMTYLDAGGRLAAREARIGLAKSATQVRLDDLKSRMALALDGVTDKIDVIRALIDLHAEWNKR